MQRPHSESYVVSVHPSPWAIHGTLADLPTGGTIRLHRKCYSHSISTSSCPMVVPHAKHMFPVPKPYHVTWQFCFGR